MIRGTIVKLLIPEFRRRREAQNTKTAKSIAKKIELKPTVTSTGMKRPADATAGGGEDFVRLREQRKRRVSITAAPFRNNANHDQVFPETSTPIGSELIQFFPEYSRY